MEVMSTYEKICTLLRKQPPAQGWCSPNLPEEPTVSGVRSERSKATTVRDPWLNFFREANRVYLRLLKTRAEREAKERGIIPAEETTEHILTPTRRDGMLISEGGQHE